LAIGSSLEVTEQGTVELVMALNNAMEQLSYPNCDVIKDSALTIAKVDQ